VRHPISPPQGTDTTMASRSDITVGLTPTEQWNLVRERASEAITELLLLLFFVILLVVRPLRSFVESIDHFDHETALLCPAQEDKASTSAPLAALISTSASTIVPIISRIPAIPTAPKTPVAAPALEKKPSVRPIISLNHLKVISPLKLQSVLSEQSSSKSSSNPLTSSGPSSKSSSSGSTSLFGLLFSSESSPDSSSSESLSSLSSPVQERLTRLYKEAKEHMREAQIRFEYIL